MGGHLTMRSIRQPHAEAIMRGRKIEYRTRPTKVRGKIYIYASLGRYSAAAEAAMMAEYGIDDVACDDTRNRRGICHLLSHLPLPRQARWGRTRNNDTSPEIQDAADRPHPFSLTYPTITALVFGGLTLSSAVEIPISLGRLSAPDAAFRGTLSRQDGNVAF